MNRFVVLIHIVLVLISCQSEKSTPDRRVVRFNLNGSVTSLDPAFASNQNNVWAVYQLFSGLVQLDESLQIQPNIAHSWRVDSSGKIYTFHLRSDVFFHENSCFQNGTRKVTAKDFVYSFTRVLNPQTASPGAWIFNDKIADQGLLALDDTTLRITLNKPFAPFLSQLSMPYCFVVPKEAIDAYGKAFGENPVGTGPFTLKYAEDKVKLVFHKNPRYYEMHKGKALPHLEALDISLLENKNISLLKFLQGELDLFNGIESSIKDKLLEKDGSLKTNLRKHIQLQKSPFLNTEYLAFYTDQEESEFPYSSVHFRKAVSLAIDKQLMIESLRNNVGKPAEGGFIPFGLPGHFQYKDTQNDKRLIINNLLNKCGYLDRPEPIVLHTTKEYSDLAVFIQQNLKSYSIDCLVEILPASRMKEDKRYGRLMLFRASWIADYPDAENYLSCFNSTYFAPGGPNYTHFHSKEFDALYQSALTEPNAGKRIMLYQNMDSLMMDQAPIVVLFYDESVRFSNRKLKGLNNNALNIPIFKYAYWQE
jgi:ABC-type transport system substrate-binding protein